MTQALFSVSCMLAVASASLVYPLGNYVHQYNGADFLNQHGSLHYYTAPTQYVHHG
ncbi:hypothetical protein CBL_08055 [Carabus blaptoides fortunei]